MKNFSLRLGVATIALATLLSCTGQQDRPFYDPEFRTDFGLFGHVKSVRDSVFSMKSDFGLEQRNSVLRTGYFDVDPSGILLANSESCNLEPERNEDDASTEISFTKNGKFHHKCWRKYDEEHRLIEAGEIESDQFKSAIQFIYGEDRRVKEQRYYENDEMQGRLVVEYDDDRPIKQVSYGSSYICTDEFSYDDKDRVLERSQLVHYIKDGYTDEKVRQKVIYNDKEGYYDILEYVLDIYDYDDDEDTDEMLLRVKKRCQLVDGLKEILFLTGDYWTMSEHYSYSDGHKEVVSVERRELTLDDHGNIIKSVEYDDDEPTYMYVAQIEYYN